MYLHVAAEIDRIYFDEVPQVLYHGHFLPIHLEIVDDVVGRADLVKTLPIYKVSLAPVQLVVAPWVLQVLAGQVALAEAVGYDTLAGFLDEGDHLVQKLNALSERANNIGRGHHVEEIYQDEGAEEKPESTVLVAVVIRHFNNIYL